MGFNPAKSLLHQLGAPNLCGYKSSRTTRGRLAKKGKISPCDTLLCHGGTPMLDPKLLEDFSAKMSALLANSPVKDIEKNAKAALGGVFAKLDLVTREEFDVQAQVLARTRAKLKDLEARVTALEKARSGE
jgi:ubiquinone biosynthesis accessory factor UbiK